MSLIERFGEYVRACFTGLWIESHEHQDALMAIAQLCRQENSRLATWDIEQGLLVEGAKIEVNGSDPLSAIRSINSLATSDGTAILVLQNFHRFLQSAEIVQALVAPARSGTGLSNEEERLLTMVAEGRAVKAIADRNVILVKGRVVFEGDSRALLAQPDILHKHLGV